LENPEAGTNCQLLVLALARAMGYELPALRSAELFIDTDYTEFIPGIEEARTGDIIFLTRDGQTDPRLFHVGVLSFDEEGELYLNHNARHVGFARKEKLEEAMEDPRHAVNAGIKRPIVENPYGQHTYFLVTYGLEHLVITI